MGTRAARAAAVVVGIALASGLVPSAVAAEGDAVAKPRPVADCPPQLGCEWLPAPYEKADPDDPDSTGDYGNHSIADRTGPGGPKLKYIVIHDTEGSYDGSVRLAQDPAYLAWNYTIRSGDGHIAQHLDAKDIGWHAGNWYVNMHSIGIEHEGKAGTGGWYTEAMYRQSAALVRYLAKKYGIPLNPAHIIGHDQVPGATMGATRGSHWDPGPFWDWEHYFDLLGAPIGGKKSRAGAVRVGDVVTVRPGYDGNPNTLTQCEEQSPGSGPCWPGAPTNFAALHQAPDELSPLAKDVGSHPTGSADGTTAVNDVSARAQAGTRLVVAAKQGEWVQVAWAGELAWIHNPSSRPVLVRTARPTVTVRPGLPSAPVYGRAYPEATAYRSPAGRPLATPVEYTLKPGQQYVLTDRKVVTDVYGAGTFDGTRPGDRTVVGGRDVYYQVAVAHRILFVRAADVEVHEPAVIVRRARPTVSGQRWVGGRLTARPGVWSGGTVTLRFRWLRDGRPIPGASSAAYTPTPQDVGHRLRFSVTASSVNADDVRATSKAVRILR
ncbi:N-acetylmuramoyl-L-alanine amidase [Aeromicrobium wangtongii]|uniref:N-acetylmuramoyl-L-alanine amidase n=1 Tax=Aeromicrobium wangtongii TaxID=2969247 RepID=A0ABY5MBI2_9ACTN|nr:peptidoglycan recognition family protein [Aeromicrobium wangtongii]MCD9197128.1 N-acetylmuramoyl-L-alanine amidase [Aeromicrobium wangtongii]UUP15485.1 N-acetylmuramoyl-L-alanine amidase [Aeromicrobium wangtongii]